MHPIRLTSLCLLALLGPLTATAQTPTAGAVPGEADRQIALYDAEFAVAYEQGVAKVHQEKVRELDVKYLQALQRALEVATKAGQLDEALAIRAEATRLGGTTGVPATDGPSDPASLVQIRTTYRTQLGKIETERDLAAAPLIAQHEAKLEAYQTRLTTEGKLDEAVKVKAARGKAAAGLSLPGGASVATKATSRPSAADEPGWHVVFDGSGLDLWKPRESSRNFPVQDGILAARLVSDQPDFLFFKGSPDVPKNLKNFELKATVKADPEANSGFYLHLDGEGDGPLDTGLEVSLIRSPKTVTYPTGAIHGITATAPSTINQAEWFEIHLKVVDRVVTVSLNGSVYLEHLAPLSSGPRTKGILPEGGRLAIQAYSKNGAYYFQRIAIKPLD